MTNFNKTNRTLCDVSFIKFHQVCPPPRNMSPRMGALTVACCTQVGGTSTARILRKELGQGPDGPARNCSHHLHEASYKALVSYADRGVPPTTLAIALFRHPVEKFLSAFYKHEFHNPAEEDRHFNPHEGLGLVDRTPAGMQNASSTEAAIRKLVSSARSRYIRRAEDRVISQPRAHD